MEDIQTDDLPPPTLAALPRACLHTCTPTPSRSPSHEEMEDWAGQEEEPTQVDESTDPGMVGGSADVYLVVRFRRVEAGSQANRQPTRVVTVSPAPFMLRLGRSGDNEIVVDDARISRHHLRVLREDDVLFVEDLQSRNGTLVNGSWIQGSRVALVSGDVVTAGSCEIVVASRWTSRSDDAPPDSERYEVRRAGLVVADPDMRRVFQIARRFSLVDHSLLLLGEFGVGSDVVAEQIHRWSPRRAGPFVRLDCTTGPASLIEQEIFGVPPTDSVPGRTGVLVAGTGGTVFLDGVFELPDAIQARLFEALQRRSLVFGAQELPLDFRIITASHREVNNESERRRIRADLFERLSSTVLRIPPLRARPNEVRLLLEYFASSHAARLGTSVPTWSVEALEVLEGHDWPGNLDELRHAVEHAVVLASDGTISAEHLPRSVRSSLRSGTSQVARPGPSSRPSVRTQMEELERAAIDEALTAEGGNRTRASRRLGMSRRALIYKLHKYGLGGFGEDT